MSRENVDRLARGYAAFNESDDTGLLSLLSPDFVYRPRSELPGNVPSVGRDQFAQVLSNLRDVFEALRFEVEEVIDGDETVVAVIHQTARGASSGVSVDQRVTHVWKVDQSTVQELCVYSSREKALEAVGLSE